LLLYNLWDFYKQFEGKKKEAADLVVYTTGWLFVFFLVFLIFAAFLRQR